MYGERKERGMEKMEIRRKVEGKNEKEWIESELGDERGRERIIKERK